jgi:hypothetical protein
VVLQDSRRSFDPTKRWLLQLHFANFDLPGNALNGVLTGAAGQINGTTSGGHNITRVGVGTGVYSLAAPRHTIATCLQPMHFGFGEERLGGRRLYEIPKILGYCAGERGEDDINPSPHPLA